MNKKIIVGVSGGIDSTFAVLLLKEQGWDVCALHLETTGIENDDDRERLLRLQQEFSIPLLRIDCRERFNKTVVEPFLAAYRRGETPNPCVICNEALKFRILIETADALGIQYVATGHYARIVRCGDDFAIARSRTNKDQTYALYRLPADWLPRIIFPLAEIESKAAVREKLIQSLGDSVRRAQESQDICFLKDTSLESFLAHHISAEERFCGNMVDEYGHVLGRHKGLIFYTEGQRKGLGLSCGPWFVARRDFSNGMMHLKNGCESRSSVVSFDRAVWQQTVTLGRRYSVQYCYRFPPKEAELLSYNGKSGTVRFLTPCGGVSTGQSLVFYENGIMMGGGVITNFSETEERE